LADFDCHLNYIYDNYAMDTIFKEIYSKWISCDSKVC